MEPDFTGAWTPLQGTVSCGNTALSVFQGLCMCLSHPFLPCLVNRFDSYQAALSLQTLTNCQEWNRIRKTQIFLHASSKTGLRTLFHYHFLTCKLHTCSPPPEPALTLPPCAFSFTLRSHHLRSINSVCNDKT